MGDKVLKLKDWLKGAGFKGHCAAYYIDFEDSLAVADYTMIDCFSNIFAFVGCLS
jgi:hypothetical protein